MGPHACVPIKRNLLVHLQTPLLLLILPFVAQTNPLFCRNCASFWILGVKCYPDAHDARQIPFYREKVAYSCRNIEKMSNSEIAKWTGRVARTIERSLKNSWGLPEHVGWGHKTVFGRAIKTSVTIDKFRKREGGMYYLSCQKLTMDTEVFLKRPKMVSWRPMA